MTTSTKMWGVVFIGALATSAMPSAAMAQDAAESSPTFTRDVAPILQRSCQQCHRPGEIAPMSLMTYGEVRPWARSIKLRVSTGEMPPWQIDSAVDTREYLDDISLSDTEIDTIVRWVDGGAPAGSPSDMPPPRTFPAGSEWVIGEPDVIVNVKEYVVPAEGADQYFDVEMSLSGMVEGKRYIKAMELMPGDRRVLHHSTVFATTDGSMSSGVSPFERGQLLLNWAAGKAAEQFPDDTGKLIDGTASILFSQHYHSIGEPVLDQSRLGLVLYPKGVVPEYPVKTVVIGGAQNREPFVLDFPAGADNVRTDFYFQLERPAKVLDFQAHMHYRGKAMILEAILPSGERELLTSVENYNWAWQFAYAYKNPSVFPAGTMLHVIGRHDNSRANRHNPDPNNWVGYGSRTIDEMSMGVTNLVYMSQEDYEQQITQQSGSE